MGLSSSAPWMRRVHTPMQSSPTWYLDEAAKEQQHEQQPKEKRFNLQQLLQDVDQVLTHDGFFHLNYQPLHLARPLSTSLRNLECVWHSPPATFNMSHLLLRMPKAFQGTAASPCVHVYR